MEVDQIQCQFPRFRNGKVGGNQKMDEDANDGRVGRFYGWPSSRIVRVTRASGGKDRHSKVLTSKGLRDRRVRLSVHTAIQFYDLQDRLGYDQPSKAVEWLLKAAASSIAELPPMNSPFPETPKQFSNEKVGLDAADTDIDGYGGDPNYLVTKSSACSSNSETSKGSGGLSLSRSENRIKARERAKERVAEREKEKDLNPNSQITSFTELLSGRNTNESTFFHKSPASMDYLTNGVLGQLGQMQFVKNPYYNSELQTLDFGTDQFGGNGSHGYNLNFAISSSVGISGFNRGTLQSNSSSLPSMDGSPASLLMENHQQFPSGFDARLQLFYGRNNAGQKGKEKN